MAKPRKRKSAAGAPSTLRRVLWGMFALIVIALGVIAVTQPRQLPAVIADHNAVRTAYAWRDAGYTRVHNWIYPLASLREKDADPKRDGVGYKEQDREALDQLLQSKEDTTP